MNIQTEKYQVTYDADTQTMTAKGSLRLYEPQYDEILAQMKDAVSTAEGTITYDVRGVTMLNSSGTSWIYYFVNHIRDSGRNELVVLGTNQVLWQKKTLGNLVKMWPTLQLEME